MPLRQPHLVELPVDGELVLYDAQRRRLHALNPTAAFIWLQCDGEHEAACIAAELAERYPEHCSRIQEHVAKMLDLFRAEGLLST